MGEGREGRCRHLEVIKTDTQEVQGVWDGGGREKDPFVLVPKGVAKDGLRFVAGKPRLSTNKVCT